MVGRALLAREYTIVIPNALPSVILSVSEESLTAIVHCELCIVHCFVISSAVEKSPTYSFNSVIPNALTPAAIVHCTLSFHCGLCTVHCGLKIVHCAL
jgi:hypothetical protein